MDDLTELRAALIQLAKALETEAACVKRIIKLVEREQERQQPIPVERLVLSEGSRSHI